MSQLQTQPQTDAWIPATWDEYLQISSDSAYAKAKGCYHDGRMRIEMAALGNPHSRDHSIVIYAVLLFAGIKGVSIDSHDNCTYRKTGTQEIQPDVSFYISAQAEAVPWSVTVIDLDIYPPPDLVIEVAYSSLADDKGEKRLLYEAIGVKEYWIIDVENVQIFAFAIENAGSRRITQSLVWPDLDIALLEEAFRRSRQTNHGKASAWLLSQFA